MTNPFQTVSYTQCNMFVQKDVPFRPAGGDTSLQVCDRVTRVILSHVLVYYAM